MYKIKSLQNRAVEVIIAIRNPAINNSYTICATCAHTLLVLPII